VCARSVFLGESILFIALVCKFPGSHGAAGTVHAAGKQLAWLQAREQTLLQPGGDNPPETAMDQTSWEGCVNV